MVHTPCYHVTMVHTLCYHVTMVNTLCYHVSCHNGAHSMLSCHNGAHSMLSCHNSESEKLLGVIVDKYLTWIHKYHVDKTAKTLSKNVALLRRIMRYLSHHTCLTFYKNHIQSHLDYCNTSWDLSSHVSRIFTLQKMALRIIMNLPKLPPYLMSVKS